MQDYREGRDGIFRLCSSEVCHQLSHREMSYGNPGLYTNVIVILIFWTEGRKGKMREEKGRK
jgi:hypothetical protein